MITQKTAERIWHCYREIEAGQKLLSDSKVAREKDRLDRLAPSLRDAFGRRQHIQLGVPSGTGGHCLYYVSPILAESCIQAHIAAKQAELVEANEQARIEIDTPTPVPPQAEPSE